jgi:hypothetical protein
VGTVNFRDIVTRPLRSRSTADLEQRIVDLEQAVVELRRHHLRLAEITDVVQELLVPMAARDQDRIDEAIARFGKSL